MSSTVQPTTSTPATASGSSQRQRGPVEEVIAKRMRQLGKKLQRYRTYASADPSTLNADQKASLQVMPALEGAYKELEDLVRDKGPIEEQELIQAAKLREATESARSAALAESSSNSDAFKTSLVKPLSLFLRLHSLLHPARSSDHEHLTFSALQLPSQIQDEVQATDVLRVGRMYEDLTLGGEAAQAVLESLVRGRAGDDEENDHIHHLFELLNQPEPVIESALATPGEAHEDFSGAALAESTEEAIQAVPDAAVENSELPNGHPTAQEPASSGMINFLQEDELESGSQRPPALEDDYEIVPQLEAHQTSGQQPPVEETPAPTSQPTRSFAPVTSVNWTDLDDEDTHGSAQPASAAKVVDADPTPESAAYTQETSAALEVAPGTTSEGRVDTSSTLAGSSAPSKSPKGTRGGKASRKPRAPRPQQGDRQPAQKAQQQQQPVATQGGKMVDEEGFETKVRRVSQPQTRGGGQSGRGTPRGNGGRGRAGRGGRGGANGPNGERAEKASQGQTPKQAPTKGSIYKSVQPEGPKSAPIL